MAQEEQGGTSWSSALCGCEHGKAGCSHQGPHALGTVTPGSTSLQNGALAEGPRLAERPSPPTSGEEGFQHRAGDWWDSMGGGQSKGPEVTSGGREPRG